MESLYQIHIVEKNRTVHTYDPVVAKNEEEAKMESGVYHWLKMQKKRLSDVNVVVEFLGEVEVDE